MNDDVNAPHIKFLLRTLAGLGVLVLLSIQFFVMPLLFPTVSPSLGAVLARLIDSLLVALLASIMISEIILRYSVPQSDKASIEAINPLSINSLAPSCCSKSNHWYYRGHTGEFVRTVVLQEMVKYANARGVQKEVTFILLDLQNEQLLENFIEYRNATVQHPKNKLTVRSLQIKIASTLLAAASFNNASLYHKARIFLNDRFSAIRVDLCEEFAFITTEDPSEPAIQVKGGSSLWNALRRDFYLDFDRINEVNIPQSNIREITTSIDAKKVMEEMGISVGLDDSDWGSVMRELQHGKNPFSEFTWKNLLPVFKGHYDD